MSKPYWVTQCGTCGTSWALSVDHRHAVRLTGVHETRSLSPRAMARCCGQEWRWVNVTAPVTAGAEAQWEV